MILCSMLPQSTYKVWGVENISIKKFYQFEYIARYKDWEKDTESVYQLNEMICNFSNIKKIRLITRQATLTVSQGIYDEQVFNRIHNFPNLQIKGKRIVLSYTLGTDNLVNLTDLKYGLEGIRHIYRNFRYHRKNKIDIVYSVIHPWNKYMENRSQLFWKNSFIHSNDLKQKSFDFINSNLKKFPEIAQMRKQNKTLIINPNVGMKFEEFVIFVQEHQTFFVNWTNTLIFIKHHRASDIKFPLEFKVGKNSFFTIISKLTSLVPTELIYYSIENIKILTAPSSLLALNRNIILQHPLTSVDKKNYKLLLSHLNKFCEIEILD